MNILENWLKRHPSDSTSDIPLYEIVAEEIESGILHKGTWAKAFAEANADKDKARALYLKLRVAQLPQEIAAFHAAREESRRTFYEAVKALGQAGIPDMDRVPSEQYEGSPSSLSQPIPAADISKATGLLEFQIIDLIKLGKLTGVRCGEEWFVDGAYVGRPC